MEPIIAVLVGFLIGCSTYLMLQRNLIRFVLGLALISHAANLLIFASGGLTRGLPAVIMAGKTVPEPGVANALPQALILTAIVISFSVLTFALVLAFRAYQRLQTVDTDAMRVAEPPIAVPAAARGAEVGLP